MAKVRSTTRRGKRHDGSALRAAVMAECRAEFETYSGMRWVDAMANRWKPNAGGKRAPATALDARAFEVLAELRAAVRRAIEFPWTAPSAPMAPDTTAEDSLLVHAREWSRWHREITSSPLAWWFVQDHVQARLRALAELPPMAEPMRPPAEYEWRTWLVIDMRNTYMAPGAPGAVKREGELWHPSDRYMAVVSLLAGQWTAKPTEPLTVSEVIERETKAVRLARLRLAKGKR